ncbi:GH36-type glycosyl hydrolase domain-containing protein [Poriferisphaera sp. WC338]|uniref:GH36-type glycosyl hydrolase domain-containing protein n=1 Tax=Poriferisphaera sp. WC338 TaxID=3425129 RepID=UPI003D816595
MSQAEINNHSELHNVSKEKKQFQNTYGYFANGGKEYVITRPDTPKPWINVIAPGPYGMTITQSGSGYSWNKHAGLNRITRWSQDLVIDEWGKYIYIQDTDSMDYWSAGYKPVCREPEKYECRHGLGYTTITSENNLIESELTMYVPYDATHEVWILKVTNNSERTRNLSMFSYFEWCLGTAPDWHREFHKVFTETKLDHSANAIFAAKRMWDVTNDAGQHWNRSWEGIAFHTASKPLADMSGSKEAFIGLLGNFAAPRALKEGKYLNKTTGKWDDSIASLNVALTLAPGESETIVFTLGTAKDETAAKNSFEKYENLELTLNELEVTKELWQGELTKSWIETPDDSLNFMSNYWLKYQTMAARTQGRTGYYQTGGGYGFRDQLQDNLMFLHMQPTRTRDQIILHAAHQYEKGHVLHWWQPITEQGMESHYSDDLLWLPFVLIHYLNATGDLDILNTEIPYYNNDKDAPIVTGTLHEHCCRAIGLSLSRRSERGLPLIGTGDWNDGLSVTGWRGQGESVWVGIFLFGILNDYAAMIDRAVENKTLSIHQAETAKTYLTEASILATAVNEHGWDGEWYWAASTDDRDLLGSKTSDEGNIHLNPQTWSILNGIAPKERVDTIINSIEKKLYRDYGPLLLQPAYTKPNENVGYLTRYAPGVRENGGLYTHAGAWAIMMECSLKRADKAWKLFTSLCPINRGNDPDLYLCEPYVTPGNVDGPDSPFYGRGGWTWYTGSAAWLYRVMNEWVLGIRPTWDGLLIDPCIPSHWTGYKAVRTYRDCEFTIEVQKPSPEAKNVAVILVNDQPIEGNLIPPLKAGSTATVKVLMK